MFRELPVAEMFFDKFDILELIRKVQLRSGQHFQCARTFPTCTRQCVVVVGGENGDEDSPRSPGLERMIVDYGQWWAVILKNCSLMVDIMDIMEYVNVSSELSLSSVNLNHELLLRNSLIDAGLHRTGIPKPKEQLWRGNFRRSWFSMQRKEFGDRPTSLGANLTTLCRDLSMIFRLSPRFMVWMFITL